MPYSDKALNASNTHSYLNELMNPTVLESAFKNEQKYQDPYIYFNTKENKKPDEWNGR